MADAPVMLRGDGDLMAVLYSASIYAPSQQADALVELLVKLFDEGDVGQDTPEAAQAHTNRLVTAWDALRDRFGKIRAASLWDEAIRRKWPVP
jgi:hypothetical protein